MKRFAMLLGAASLGLLAGCGHGVTTYNPQLRAWGELTMRYDDGFSMTAEGKEIASGNTWSGLTEYVQCVPKAREHAEAAESHGTAAVALSWIGAGVGLASLGSLAAVPDYDKHQELSNVALALGLTGAITGVVLAAIGRGQKPVANGHAVDAMNYYNDAVGSRGGTCKKPAADLPEREVVPVQDSPEKKVDPKLDEDRGPSPKPADKPAPGTDI
ncbi:MAG: hypothetical protein U0441_36195 [Polyangiaceae bacterium]